MERKKNELMIHLELYNERLFFALYAEWCEQSLFPVYIRTFVKIRDPLIQGCHKK